MNKPSGQGKKKGDRIGKHRQVGEEKEESRFTEEEKWVEIGEREQEQEETNKKKQKQMSIYSIIIRQIAL